MLGPAPRFRFYGSPRNYLTAAAAVLSRPKSHEVERLEGALQQRLGVAHAIALSQGRLGIHLAVKHLLTAGKEVILSPYTIYDVINMVIAAGAIPVFCDIDPATCNIDLEKARQLINPRTGAILITHLHGLMADAQGFRRLCDEHGLYLIEDAAQAYGARSGDRPSGTIGHVGVYSFGRVKNLNGFYGGAVVTGDAALAGRIRAEVRGYKRMTPSVLFKRILNCLIADIATMPGVFQLATFWIFRYACLNGVESVSKIVDTEEHPERRDRLPERYQRQITPLQARIVLSQLDAVDTDTRARIGYALLYAASLEGLATIELPPTRSDGSHAYLVYPVQVADRQDFVKHMMRHGRDLSIQHYNNTADLPCFRDVTRDCPIARAVSRRVVLLPTYPRFGADQVERTIGVAREYSPASNTARDARKPLAS
jgi:dTDP-4-amino-4,6-dideoxygalactose transaminase